MASQGLSSIQSCKWLLLPLSLRAQDRLSLAGSIVVYQMYRSHKYLLLERVSEFQLSYFTGKMKGWTCFTHHPIQERAEDKMGLCRAPPQA
jgi:hypothetical protein